MDDGWSNHKLQREIERDGFGTLAGPQSRTPILYIGDAVTVLSDHPTSPPMTLHGEVTRLSADTVTVYVEELGVHNDYPYSEVRRG